jgi:hypothetical protein
MLRLASDADFNADILRGLFRRQPDLNLIRVRDVDSKPPMTQAYWNGRQAADGSFSHMFGLPCPVLPMIVYGLDNRCRGSLWCGTSHSWVRLLMKFLLVALCSSQEEWKDRVEFLPL